MVDAKIEIVRLHRLDNGGPVKAFCDIQFGDSYIIKGFRVVEGKEGLFVGMPCDAGKNGRWYDTFTPLTDDARDRITKAVIAAYEE